MDDPCKGKERKQLLNTSLFQRIIIPDNEIIDIDSLGLNSDDDTWLYSTDESVKHTSKIMNQSVNSIRKTCNSIVCEPSISSESTISPLINNTQDYNFSNTVINLLNDNTVESSSPFSCNDVTRDDNFTTNCTSGKKDNIVSHLCDSPILPEIKRVNNRFSTITKSPQKTLRRRDTYDLSEEKLNDGNLNDINGNNVADTISPIEIDNTFKIPTAMKNPTLPVTPRKSISYPTHALGHSTPRNDATFSKYRIGSSSDENVEGGNHYATYKKPYNLNESYVKSSNHHKWTFNIQSNNTHSIKVNNEEIKDEMENNRYRTYVADLNETKDDVENRPLSRRSKSAEGLLSSSEESIFSKEGSTNCILTSIKERKSNLNLNIRKDCYETSRSKVCPSRKSNLTKAMSLATLSKPDGLFKSRSTNKFEQNGRPSYAPSIRAPISSVTNRKTHVVDSNKTSNNNCTARIMFNGSYMNSKMKSTVQMNSTFRKNKPTYLNQIYGNVELSNGNINEPPVKSSVVDVTKVGKNGSEGKPSGIPRMSRIPKPSRIPAPRSSSISRVAPRR